MAAVLKVKQRDSRQTAPGSSIQLKFAGQGQGSVNYMDLTDKAGTLPICVNKVLLEYSHIYHFHIVYATFEKL